MPPPKNLSPEGAKQILYRELRKIREPFRCRKRRLSAILSAIAQGATVEAWATVEATADKETLISRAFLPQKNAKIAEAEN